MTNELTTQATATEKALVEGDLGALSPEQRVMLYKQTCESVGLNPLTQPFKYIKLNGKLTLYATKDCTDQIRTNRGVSVEDLRESVVEGVFFVKAKGHDKTGRTDLSTGAVNIAGLKGEALANAMMKAETKAKRRLTLSLCGLGILDESEVGDIRGAQVDVVDVSTGNIREPSALPAVTTADQLRQKPEETRYFSLDACDSEEERAGAHAFLDKYCTLDLDKNIFVCTRKFSPAREAKLRRLQVFVDKSGNVTHVPFHDDNIPQFELEGASV